MPTAQSNVRSPRYNADGNSFFEQRALAGRIIRATHSHVCWSESSSASSNFTSHVQSDNGGANSVPFFLDATIKAISDSLVVARGVALDQYVKAAPEDDEQA